MSVRCVTDGGLETDLVFHYGLDLPEFAAFPLLDSEDGRGALRRYYADYVRIAAVAGAPLQLDTPTWRANADHGGLLGYSAVELDRVNRQAVDFMRAIGEQGSGELAGFAVGGMLGPRGDGYRSDGPIDPDRAAEYHRPQLASFAAAGADLATAQTLIEVGEAVGVVRAAVDAGIPIAVGFTVETDGRLPDGTTIARAIELVDTATGAAAAYFMINCAHPTHIRAGIAAAGGGTWVGRVGGLRVNASTMSHAQLDEAEELDDGDPRQLAADQAPLIDLFESLEVLGGCCGTDARHIAAMWGVPLT